MLWDFGSMRAIAAFCLTFTTSFSKLFSVSFNAGPEPHAFDFYLRVHVKKGL